MIFYFILLLLFILTCFHSLLGAKETSNLNFLLKKITPEQDNQPKISISSVLNLQTL